MGIYTKVANTSPLHRYRSGYELSTFLQIVCRDTSILSARIGKEVRTDHHHVVIGSRKWVMEGFNYCSRNNITVDDIDKKRVFSRKYLHLLERSLSLVHDCRRISSGNDLYLLTHTHNYCKFRYDMYSK